MTLNDPVKLERLSCRNFERSRSMLIRNLVHLQPLVRLTNASRHPHPNHKTVRRLRALSLPLITDIPVILLIYSMELRELPVTRSQRAGARIVEAFSDCPTQVARCSFDMLVGNWLWLSFTRLYRVYTECFPY